MMKWLFLWILPIREVLRAKPYPQVYVYAPDSGNADRPVKKLFGFEKVEIEPGETKTVEIRVDASDLWYYEDETEMDFAKKIRKIM